MRTIVAAGVTVAAASASLMVAELGFSQTFGPGLALAILIALLVAIVFIPAMLAVLGAWVFWPARPGRDVPAEREARNARRERPVSSGRARSAWPAGGR